jgi:tetratricopeptide (TPR) repeat protein
MPARALGLSAAGAPTYLAFADETLPRVTALLAEAAAAHGEGARAETLLKAAQHADPHCLAVYFALYKFYFYRGRLIEAERAALDGLAVAAAQGRFASDWEILHTGSADWTRATGPVRFYLFSLKALAFIRLRRGRTTEAAAILAKLAELDPTDQVGGSVIRSLAEKIR